MPMAQPALTSKKPRRERNDSRFMLIDLICKRFMNDVLILPQEDGLYKTDYRMI